VEFQGNDVWIGTGHGLARGVGTGYFGGLSRPAAGSPEERDR